MKQQYDCRSCGACCVGEEVNTPGFADCTEKDVVRMSRLIRSRLVQDLRGNFSTPDVETDEYGKSCAFLRGTPGKRCSCRIYDSRPDVCRNFRPGTGSCMAARADLGMDIRP